MPEADYSFINWQCGSLIVDKHCTEQELIIGLTRSLPTPDFVPGRIAP
jgi:hypothetical protein